ncbi:hypothetical protein GCM10022631_20640 [Deinococcus rubellus]
MDSKKCRNLSRIWAVERGVPEVWPGVWAVIIASIAAALSRAVQQVTVSMGAENGGQTNGRLRATPIQVTHAAHQKSEF